MKIFKEDGTSVEFTCECGCNKFDEIIKDATVSMQVLGIGDGGDIEYDNDSCVLIDGITSHYVCRGCDKEFNFNNSTSFYDFLIQNI